MMVHWYLQSITEFCNPHHRNIYLPREIEEKPCSAKLAQYHDRRLDCKEDHEEAAGDGIGGDHRLEIRAEPFG